MTDAELWMAAVGFGIASGLGVVVAFVWGYITGASNAIVAAHRARKNKEKTLTS